ncbi:MAG: hypothetical protein ACXWZ2_18365 [Mycobacterium sp.]
MGIATTELSPIEQTAFLTEYARALDSQWPRPAPQKMFKDIGSHWGYAGFKDAHYPQTWNPRMTLVEEASLTDQPEVDLFAPWIRVATRLADRTKSGARKARVLRYAF